ncbi:MAG: hypothetical protein DWQ09_04420 [Proteobacteria bacterium]|nr:MAG: hypothetical protein DWQ09_04420 [Pseudomonadota bacterium]QKK11226.1 MAG: hypothetical protein HND59_06075 [Pseudomonadota bacterium]
MISRLALAAWVLVLVLLVLGAYLRHSHAGSGCSEWPACYGRIGSDPTLTEPLKTDHKPSLKAQPHWATRAHRAVAGLIAVLVVAIAVLCVARRERRTALMFSLLALANLVFLVALGLWAGGSRSPSVTVGNLLGGISLLGLLWWLYLETRSPATALTKSMIAMPIWIGIGLVLVTAEIVLGAITSAKYAALACASVPDCNGLLWPSTALGDALDLFRSLPTDSSGTVIGGAEQIAIQLSHRIGAAVLLVWGAFFIWKLLTTGQRPRGWDAALLLLLLFQSGLGMGTAVAPSTLAIALGHNIGAPLLLVAMLGALHHHLAAGAPSPLNADNLKEFDHGTSHH